MRAFQRIHTSSATSLQAATTAESRDQPAATDVAPAHQGFPQVVEQRTRLQARFVPISRKRIPQEGDNPNEPYGYADWGSKRFKVISDRDHQRPTWTKEELEWIEAWCEMTKKHKEKITREERFHCVHAISNSESARALFHPHHVVKDRIDHVFKHFRNL
jgi:hypothetical protein